LALVAVLAPAFTLWSDFLFEIMGLLIRSSDVAYPEEDILAQPQSFGVAEIVQRSQGGNL